MSHTLRHLLTPHLLLHVVKCHSGWNRAWSSLLVAIGVVPLPQNGLRHVLSHVLWVALRQELLVDKGEVSVARKSHKLCLVLCSGGGGKVSSRNLILVLTCHHGRWS